MLAVAVLGFRPQGFGIPSASLFPAPDLLETDAHMPVFENPTQSTRFR